MLSLVITLIVIGILLWLMETYLPIDATIKKIIYAVVIIVTVLWILQSFGLIASINNIRIR